MDLGPSPRSQELQVRLLEFMDSHIYPNEAVHEDQIRASGDPHFHPPIMEELKAEARRRGLWNLFLPDKHWGGGLTNLEYAPIAEITGRSLIAPEALNCAAPDTGNMEVLAMFGTPAQQQRWLVPLLAGEMRSCFAMTEPAVASSDATNIEASIERQGDHYLINGHKWWATGALDRSCKLAIFMGKTDPTAPRHRQQSMILIPLDAPGVRVLRNLTVFGYTDDHGHGEILFENVTVPVTNLLAEEGSGFAIAQARLGPGRIHHCMRSLGAAERALELMCRRVSQRVAFGQPLATQGVIRKWIAESRIEIEQARLLVLKAAWHMDTSGNKAARHEISAIKVAVPKVALKVTDRAIQAHGGAGVSGAFPLARMYANLRTMRIADGPDEVHERTIALRELKKYATPVGVGAPVVKS